MTISEEYYSTVRRANNIPELFFELAQNMEGKILGYQAQVIDKTTSWRALDYRSTAQKISRLAAAIQKLGVNKGDRVAIISGTRAEWLEIDLAILSIGAIAVAIYPSLPASDIAYILHDSAAQLVFAENEEQLQKLLALTSTPQLIPAREGLPDEAKTVTISTIITIEETSSHTNVVRLDDLINDIPETTGIPSSTHLISRADVASLVYTSGTTGPSKGVVQTHGNHLSNVAQAIECGMFAMDGTLFLYLPLAHSFARLIGYIGFLTPANIKFSSVADTKTSRVDLLRVASDMCKSNATVFPSVPRLFEKIRDKLEHTSSKRGLTGFLLSATLKNAKRVFEAQESGKAPNSFDSILSLLFSPLRAKIKRSIFGQQFQHSISGGAKLPVDVNRFFWGLGIEIYEGYGLTETCVATNVNRKGANKFGSVGKAMVEVNIKIADDGEICFKGPNITQGYWNRPQATAESWDSNGWFHTGDIGHLDENGYLFITDRKKDLIVTAGGKKIPPIKVENILTSSKYISHAVFCGDGKPYCVALVTLNEDAVIDYLMKRGVSATEPLSKIQLVAELLEEIRKRTNTGLSSFEEVKKIAVIDEDFSVDNGLLTPSLKIKRKSVLKKYSELLESLY